MEGKGACVNRFDSSERCGFLVWGVTRNYFHDTQVLRRARQPDKVKAAAVPWLTPSARVMLGYLIWNRLQVCNSGG